jgi:hypothetical protein
MAEELSEEECYNEILSRLEKLGATALLNEIKEVVAKPVTETIRDTKQTEIKTRELNPKEKLAVALTLLATFGEVPLMLEKTRTTLGGEQLRWAFDGATSTARPMASELSDDELNRISSASSSSTDISPPSNISPSLQKIRTLMKELDLKLPEE